MDPMREIAAGSRVGRSLLSLDTKVNKHQTTSKLLLCIVSKTIIGKLVNCKFDRSQDLMVVDGGGGDIMMVVTSLGGQQ